MNKVTILGDVDGSFGKYDPSIKFSDLDENVRSKVKNYDGFYDYVSGKENLNVVLDFKLNGDLIYFCQMGGDWEDPCRFFLVNKNNIYIPPNQNRFPFRPEVRNNVERFLNESSIILNTAQSIINGETNFLKN